MPAFRGTFDESPLRKQTLDEIEEKIDNAIETTNGVKELMSETNTSAFY